MSKVLLTNDTDLTSIANAIRAKNGTTQRLIYPDDYIIGIRNISADAANGDSLISVSDAKVGEICSLTQYGVCEQNQSTNAISCNNGTLSISGGEIVTTAANNETIVVGNQTANVENLYSVENVRDEQEIITGRIIHRNNVCIYDGTQPVGDRYLSSTGTKENGAIIVYPMETEHDGQSIVTFNEDESKEVNSLKVNVSPKQDLHGYSKPWAGGTGKNILPYPYTPSSSTVAGIQVTVNDDGSVVLDGTTTSKLEYYLSSRTLGGPLKLGAGNYILTGCPKGYESKHLRIGYNRGSSGTTLGSDTGDGVAITQADSKVLDYGVWIACDSGTILDNLVIKPMVRLASETDPTWEPYANVCPISGSTGLSVYVSPTQDVADATTYAEDWTSQAGTVYGGTVDIKSGTLTVDRVLVTKTWADGSNATTYGDCTRKRFSYSDMDDKEKKTSAICNVASYILNDTSAEWAKGSLFSIHGSSKLFYLSLPTSTDGTTEIQLCYYLATPVIYQLTPQYIDTLIGINNFICLDGFSIKVFVSNSLIENVTPQPLALLAGNNTISANNLSVTSVPLKMVYNKLEQAFEKDVNFIDYDGKIKYSYTASEFANLTELPANPSHTGLTAQGWNWTLANAKAVVVKYGGVLTIGQMYTTSDGKTRIYISLIEGRTEFPFRFYQSAANGVSVDWGDSSQAETFSGTGTITTSHAYASAGEYVISLSIVSGTAQFDSYINGSNSVKKSYPNSIKKVEIGPNFTNLGRAFDCCYSLKSITIPNTVTGMSAYAFSACHSLSSVTIPNSITTIPSYCFNNCMSLMRVSFPKEITLYNPSTFNGIVRFDRFYIMDDADNLGTSMFSYCTSLTSLTFPTTVTQIGAGLLTSCSCVSTLRFYPTTPPTVSNSNAWSSLPADCIIYVPYRDTNSLTEGAVMEAYLSATNYPSSSTYTYIAVATYANNVSLPSETASVFLKWYATKEDAIAETNRIYYGNGNEIYARLEGMLPSFTYTGTYTIVQDSAMNWRIKFLTSGTFTPANSLNVDIFCVGGGGGGKNGSTRQAGGGGGYTQTLLNQTLTANTAYTVTVGAGGVVEGDGGASSFGSLLTAEGGKKAASYSTGGAGGSGGAGCSTSTGATQAYGGSDGSNGEAGGGAGGAGQGTTTREFGELTGDLYSGGGQGGPTGSGNPSYSAPGGGGAVDQPGTDNTGGGGGRAGAGGSGIVIIRNTR